MALERRRGFKPDHQSFGRFILSEQARRPAAKAAADIADYAQQIAPRGEEADADRYAESFEVIQAGTYTAKNGNIRAIALVTNSNEAAPAVEFGRGPGAGREGPRGGHRTLRRAGAPWDTGRTE